MSTYDYMDQLETATGFSLDLMDLMVSATKPSSPYGLSLSLETESSPDPTVPCSPEGSLAASPARPPPASSPAPYRPCPDAALALRTSLAASLAGPAGPALPFCGRRGPAAAILSLAAANIGLLARRCPSGSLPPPAPRAFALPVVTGEGVTAFGRSLGTLLTRSALGAAYCGDDDALGPLAASLTSRTPALVSVCVDLSAWDPCDEAAEAALADALGSSLAAAVPSLAPPEDPLDHASLVTAYGEAASFVFFFDGVASPQAAGALSVTAAAYAAATHPASPVVVAWALGTSDQGGVLEALEEALETGTDLSGRAGARLVPVALGGLAPPEVAEGLLALYYESSLGAAAAASLDDYSPRSPSPEAAAVPTSPLLSPPASPSPLPPATRAPALPLPPTAASLLPLAASLVAWTSGGLPSLLGPTVTALASLPEVGGRVWDAPPGSVGEAAAAAADVLAAFPSLG